MPPDAQTTHGTVLPLQSLHSRPSIAAAVPSASAFAERTPWPSPLTLGLVALAHVLLFSALASLNLISVPVPEVVTMVKMVMPIAPPKAEVTPPKPLPATPKLKPPPQIRTPQTLAAVPRSESPIVVQSETESPPSKDLPAPNPQPIAAEPVPAAAAKPVLQSAPRFDANYLDNPAPIYPAISRRANEEGKVVLHVHVEANGTPSQVEIRSSSGFERLDKAAIAAVSQWKFTPAKKGNEAVAAWVLVPIVFSLKS